MKLFSPAKLNLFLRVLGKREDGYHEVAYAMQAVSLGDHIEIALSEEDKLEGEGIEITYDSSNLIYKALDLYRKKTKKHFHAHFRLKKKIPIGRGLGGGSSNAATALWGINALLGGDVSEKQLASWGKELGVDTPFFFSMGMAYCTGKGDKIENLDSQNGFSCFIATIDGELLTPVVYSCCRPHACSQEDPFLLREKLLKGNPEYVNDLEDPAFFLMPQLVQLKINLERIGFSRVTMTGSGSAFFCLGDVVDPQLDGVTFYRVHNIQRTPNRWYQLDDK